MPLTAGAHLGPYEILATIGVGGMGEVYRARDTKLHRDVAIKILPESVAADPERVARFEREAKTLAALNHPHIAHIHGLEESDGVRALVMEFVDGENLAERLERGPIPIDEALPIARQIAEALVAAHEQGIIHRDLKPANIKVRGDGTVKVLDFGLAKALDAQTAAATRVSARALSSPTVTSPAMTQIGVILGTAAYMSPEQAKGKAVDKRADVWAFGCVLYEMLTGRRAFAGDDVSDTLAFVLTKPTDWSAIPSETPPSIRRLLRRCLERNVSRRLADIADARLEIDDASEDAPSEAPTASGSTAWRRFIPWALAAALAVALGVAIAVLGASSRARSTTAMARLDAHIGANVALTTDPANALTVSRDGRLVAFSAATPGPDGQVRVQIDSQGLPRGAGSVRLYLRRIDQLQAMPLEGTDGAFGPFFSPDSQWIGFFAGGKLKKVAVTGGAVVLLCDAPIGRGAHWAEDGTIVFAPSTIGQDGKGLWRVSDAGGTPQPLTELTAGEITHRWPQVLPGGNAMLYTAHNQGVNFDAATLVVQSLAGGAPKIVVRNGYYGRYLSTGHLAYVHDATLFVVPFDTRRLEVSGQPVPILQNVASLPRSGAAHFAVADTGLMVYLRDDAAPAISPIHWLNREGQPTPLRARPANWGNPAFAPDGRRLAMTITAAGDLLTRFVDDSTNIWVYEPARDALAQVTRGGGNVAVWTPDGRHLVFRSARDGELGLFWQRADGTGEAQRLTRGNHVPGSWHPDGKQLAFVSMELGRPSSISILPVAVDAAGGWKAGEARVFATAFRLSDPMFSPDGRWLAYHSAESGSSEVYVQAFPAGGGKVVVSTGGGALPTWSQRRPELLHVTPHGEIMVVPYTIEGDTFRPDRARPWSSVQIDVRRSRAYALHPDGDRLAVALAPEREELRDSLVFVFDFFDGLRAVKPASR
jgi:serine/threonine-protein kinase